MTASSAVAGRAGSLTARCLRPSRSFPVLWPQVITAQATHAAGIKVLMGSPNLIRGRSHSGNVAATTLASRNCLDILSSDYIPASMLQAALRLTHEDFGWTLLRALATVTSAPASAAGLADRGRLEEGLRADLVRVEIDQDRPVVRTVWSAGNRVI